MKRILKLFTIMVLTLLLASCGSLMNRPTKKSELDLSAKELSNLVKDVEVDLSLEKGISFDLVVDVDFEKIDKYSSDNKLRYDNRVKASIKGNLSAFANLSSKDDLYISLKGGLDVSVRVHSQNEEEEFDFTVEGHLKLEAYLVNGSLYVESDLEAMGISISAKQKVSNIINDKLYDMLFGNLKETIENLDVDLNVAKILEEFDHKDLVVYKVGKLHEVEFPFGEQLEKLVKEQEYDYSDKYGHVSLYEAVKNDFDKTKAYVRFNDKTVEKLGVVINADVEILDKRGVVDSYMYEDITKVKGNLEVHLDLNAKAPKKVNESKLKGYYDQEDVKRLLNNLIGDKIYEVSELELPKIDKGFSTSKLVIDNGNKEVKGSLKETKINALIKTIDTKELVSNPIRIQADVDFYYGKDYYQNYYGWIDKNLTEVRVKGTVDAFLDTTSFKDLYGYVDVDLNLKVNIKQGDYIDEEMIAVDVDIKGSIYVIGKDVFVTLSVSSFGQTAKIEAKMLDVIKKADYDQLIIQLEAVPEFNLSSEEIPMDLIRLYEVGKKDHVEVLLNSIITELVAEMNSGGSQIPGVNYVTVLTNDIKGSNGVLVFGDNGLERLGVALDVDVKYRDEYQGLWDDMVIRETITYKGRLNVIVDFDAKDPAKRLTANNFKKHYELDKDILNMLLPIYGIRGMVDFEIGF